MTTQIIFLHGASSAGKSTLARALQDVLPVPYWHVSIDKIRDADVLPTTRFQRGGFSWSDHRAAFFNGFHASLLGFAEAGNNLIVEHILEDGAMRAQVMEMLQPFPVFWVGLHTPLGVLVAREATRQDRPIGSAAQDFDQVHVGMRYDLELDGTLPAPQNAPRVARALKRGV
ncbi:MAG: AAA family ATPase [Pseudomonadota bacterium]